MKLVIASVPWTDTEAPLSAPALLKASAVYNGIPTIALDLNQEVINFCKINFSNDKAKKIQNFFYEEKEKNIDDEIQQVINFIIEKILIHKPTHVALSLLSYTSQTCCNFLSFQLRIVDPTIKIIIGGPGVFNTLNSNLNFGEKLLKQEQIDYYIKGDGEKSLIDLLKETKSTGINSNEWTQLDDLNNLPYPDYSDYNWDLYKNKSLGIVGSRGCVRKCTFCDIHEHWKKYQWRTGIDIFNELLWHNKNTGCRLFKFQDSLINGNQLEFRKLMELLYQHNKKNPQNTLHWSSFFIFRPKTQMNEHDWKIISESAEFLIVGIESLDENVRAHMGKKFSNNDLDYCLSMCQKYRIKLRCLLLVGYVTENNKTHQNALEWFRKNKHYANNPIITFGFGGTLGILPGTYLFRNQKSLKIILKDHKFDHNWSSEDGLNTPTVRLKWHSELVKEAKNCGFAINSTQDNFLIMENMSKK